MADPKTPQRKDTATAPYNFVSLPQGVLTVPIEGGRGNDEDCDRAKQSYRAHVLADHRLSGHIVLTIETKTPVFVGAGAQETFFAPSGDLRIPGSTMRGMVKNLFKIVTCGAMRSGEDYYDRTLYFRTMADKHLNKLYADEMSSQALVGKNRISKTKSKAGYLVQERDDPHYYICPADFEVIPDKKGGTHHNEIIWGADESGIASCYTGEMSSKSTYTKHHSPNWMEHIPVPDSVVQAYREDISRKGVDLLDEKDKNGDPKPFFISRRDAEAAKFTGDPAITFVVPCFYKQKENGDVCHFGFGRFYRIPYHHSIGEHVLGMDTDGFDYADLLFGCKELWASRLAFTDALPKGDVQMESAAYPCVLSEPKPTSVQLYLEQSSNRLAHWDDINVPIRGYKLYWHQKNSSAWRAEKKEESNVVKSRITPVKAGTVFHSSIRFERLSGDELGALLQTLQITGKQLCCKIGKGKSLGLGSVQIKSTLFLTDMADAYRCAFDAAGGWNAAEREASEEEMQSYKTAFDDILHARLNEETKKRYDIAINELKCLLDWGRTQHPMWAKNIAQMSIDGGKDSPFRSRAILPTAQQVKPK